MKCPVCRALYRLPDRSPNCSLQSPLADDVTTPLICRRCGADLTPLIRLHDQAMWHHHQALAYFQQGDYAQALASNARALALHQQHSDFHALAGQLLALEGDFAAAMTAWATALRLDPSNVTAQTGLLFRQQTAL